MLKNYIYHVKILNNMKTESEESKENVEDTTEESKCKHGKIYEERPNLDYLNR